jgi:hypothetical protein
MVLNMENKKKINYTVMTKKINEWKKDIEKDKPLMESLKKLADK